MTQFRPIRVALLGTDDGPVRTMLAATLARGRARCELVAADSGSADVVLTMIRWARCRQSVAVARSIARPFP